MPGAGVRPRSLRHPSIAIENVRPAEGRLRLFPDLNRPCRAYVSVIHSQAFGCEEGYQGGLEVGYLRSYFPLGFVVSNFI